MEAIGAEPRNFWQENFVGRKIFRRLTSPLAATLPAVAVSDERRIGNDFSRRFRVRQIKRLLLIPMRFQDWTNTGFVACLQAIQDAKIARKRAPTPEAVSLFFIRINSCPSVVKNVAGWAA